MNYPLLKIKITGPEQATKCNFSIKLICEVVTTQSASSVNGNASLQHSVRATISVIEQL
jgi:hypothetical protein